MSQYLIWSNEHRSWWASNCCGYTISIERAGRYSREEALDIAGRARGGWAKGKNPPEIALPEADAIAQSSDPRRIENYENQPKPICRGSFVLGTACGRCARCDAEADMMEGEDCR